ncbi:sensor histidine kinase [Streptomyces sp. RGM 3693]|uniref:sensor histidine kinase n=1 Tax=Streptomyces sp. RGM 3693 TaxID=3413284 RepID=UPI003D29B415
MPTPFAGDEDQDGEPAGATPGRPGQRLPERHIPPPRLARAVTVTVLVGYGAVTLLNVLRGHPRPQETLACLASVAAVFTVQFVHSAPATRHWPPRRKALTLGLQALLTYLPFFWFGINWGSMAGPLAGSILLMLPGLLGWSLYALVCVSMLTYSLSLGLSVLDVCYFTIASVLTGLVIFGLTRLTDLVQEVHAARSELAHLAVANERLRFARDLHDLLGYSLSAITLKSELTHRLVLVRPTQAREEITSILEISRQALSDVRVVASGYREMSLEAEVASAESMLAAAGIEAEVSVGGGRLHPVVGTVLATALREGITNILRHSKVQHCWITVTYVGDDGTEGDAQDAAGTVRLTLVNDGVPERLSSREELNDGSGLGNLSTRLTEIGGRLTAGPEDDGRFRLVATAPQTPLRRPDAAHPGKETSPHNEQHHGQHHGQQPADRSGAESGHQDGQGESQRC